MDTQLEHLINLKLICKDEAEKLLLNYLNNILPKGCIEWVSDCIRDAANNGQSELCISEKDLSDESLKRNDYPTENRWDIHDLDCLLFVPETIKVSKKHLLFKKSYTKQICREYENILVNNVNKRIDILNSIAEWAKMYGYEVEHNAKTWSNNIFYFYNKAITIKWHDKVIKKNGEC